MHRNISAIILKLQQKAKKKEALRPLFLLKVRLILTEVPLAVHIVEIKLAK